jgi:hypothetical protein
VVLAPGTIAPEKSGFVGCALALAGGCRVCARGVRPRGNGRLGLSHTPLLGAATAIPPALVAAFLLAVGRLSVLPAGPSPPPPPCRRAALGATIAGLGMCRPEGFLAPLEQTPSLSGPTSPLTGSRCAASLGWAQGSGELPTAKPRVRSLLHPAPRRLVSPHRPSWPITSPYRTADLPGFQYPRARHLAETHRFRSDAQQTETVMRLQTVTDT